MFRLHLTETHTIIKNSQEIILDRPLYNVAEESTLKENGFFKCHKCKEYFDVIMEHGLHPDADGKMYCEPHFPG